MRRRLGVNAGRTDAGFTTLELIVVMILVGILAVVVIPRFADQTVFEARGFRDQTVATLQYARKAAVASRRSVCVDFDLAAARISLSRATASPEALAATVCDAPLAIVAAARSRGGGADNTLRIPPEAALALAPGGTTRLQFDALGALIAPGAGASLAIAGQPVITVEAVTGYVH